MHADALTHTHIRREEAGMRGHERRQHEGRMGQKVSFMTKPRMRRRWRRRHLNTV